MMGPQSIELHRHELSAAMRAPIISVISEPDEKDPLLSAALVRYSVYLLYWYNSTNIDAFSAARVSILATNSPSSAAAQKDASNASNAALTGTKVHILMQFLRYAFQFLSAHLPHSCLPLPRR
jgi:hypothetical protein